jgi:hypothetical protein
MFALSLCAPLSAEASATLTLSSETIAADATEVTLSATLEDNPGMSSIAVRVEYDADAFTIVKKDIKNGDVFESIGDKVVKPAGTDKLGTWGPTARIAYFASENTTEDEVLATLRFTVNEGAAAGDYNFTLYVTECWNEDDEPVAVSVVSGKVTIEAAAPAVTVGESTTVDEDEMQANLYFNIPATDDPAEYTAIVGGNEVTLDNATQTAQGYVVSAPAAGAKNMGDDIAWSISKGETVIASGTTSIKEYAIALRDEVSADLGTAMLNYGAAAQVAFNYNTDDLVGVPDAADAINFARFDADAINAVLCATDAIPVYYSALSVNYLTDITLQMAFRVKTTSTVDEALEWVEANMTLGGEAVVARALTSGSYSFIIISKADISIDAVNDPIALVAAGADFTVCPANYLASVEAVYGESAVAAQQNQLNLARALFAYASAIDAYLASLNG